jgi:hypothetical protein
LFLSLEVTMFAMSRNERRTELEQRHRGGLRLTPSAVVGEAAGVAKSGTHGGEPGLGSPRESFLLFTRREHFLHRFGKKVLAT